MRKAFLFILSFTLFSCVTSTDKIKYYSLSLNHSIEQADSKHNSRKFIVLEPVQLARYLRQQGLVIQTGNHEIATANYNRWSEPLEDLIAKKLVADLNKKAIDYYFFNQNELWTDKVGYRLKLNFEQFQATDRSTVEVSGRYWLLSNDRKAREPSHFKISRELKRDGYLHTVEQLEQAVEELSDIILVSIADLK